MRFDELDLDESVLQGLDSMNFQEMTPVQELTIPVILEGKDIIACAQTGTGKTAAYVLPVLNRLARETQMSDTVKALIMAPTRELAQQIDIQFEGFSYFLSVSTVVIYGGGDGMVWEQQKKGLRLGAEIAIATPGRLLSHIQHSDIDLSGVDYFVLDEADRMLDMGFFDDIMQIVNKLPKERQTLLFSATMPPKIRQLAKNVLRDPVEVSVAISKPNEAILQAAYICHEGQKMGIVEELFSKPVKHKTLLFSSSKQKVKDLAFTLKRRKFNVAAMHSDLEQAQREAVMLDFKNGKTDILVATDIVARGIDIEEIGLVINYDVPHDPEDYIHRIGRTARASAKGVAITFVSTAEQGKFYRIEQFLGEEVYKIPLPPGLGEAPAYDPKAFEHQERRRSNPVSRRPSRKTRK
jgi:superfamily II DNA/RNA helicase